MSPAPSARPTRLGQDRRGGAISQPGVPASRPKAPATFHLKARTPGSFADSQARPSLLLHTRLPLPFQTTASSRPATLARIRGRAQGARRPLPSRAGRPGSGGAHPFSSPATPSAVRGNRRTPPESEKARPQTPGTGAEEGAVLERMAPSRRGLSLAGGPAARRRERGGASPGPAPSEGGGRRRRRTRKGGRNTKPVKVFFSFAFN